MVVFSARPDCDDPDSATLDEVGLWVRSSVEQHTADVRVLDARAWADYYNAWCAEPAPIRPDQLAGVWLVDKVYGRFAELEGAHLLRFNPDGTYAVDYKGGLFSSSPHFYGTYRLHSASLRATAKGGDGFIKDGDRCNATERLELRIRPDSRLSLASTHGPCQDGSVWIARRILHDVGLPQPAGTGARAP